MTWAFRSAGAIVSGFNTTLTPGTPAGFLAGDLLVIYGAEFAGSDAPPDLTAAGFIKQSLNSGTNQCAIWTKIAVGADTIPGCYYGNQWAAFGCAAYSGAPSTLTGIASQAGVNRANSTLTSGIAIENFSAPPDSNVLCLTVSARNNGSATGVSIASITNFTNRATFTPNASGRINIALLDWIQSTPTSYALTIQSTSPADSAAQTNSSQTIFLKPGSAPSSTPSISMGLMGVGS
jgi:hypothetical protein